MAKRVHAVIYTRISRDDSGEAMGVKRQAEDCRRLAKDRGWTVVAVEEDNDVSAFNGRRRPAYERLLEHLRSGRANAVIAWAPDRLHRSPNELEAFIQLVEAEKVTVETVKSGLWDLTTSGGRLTARMLGAISRAESERQGERVSRAHLQAREQGLWRGAVPFGFSAAKRGCLELDKGQAKIVKRIAARVLKGDSLTRIAADLNAAGLQPRRAKFWTHSGVMRLMQSPAIGGMIRIDGELRPAAFKGIIPSDDWKVVQAAIAARPMPEKRRPRELLTLLGGILECSEHGITCYGATSKYNRLYSASRPGVCHVTIGRPEVDEFVTAVVLERLKRKDARAALTPPKRNRTSDAEANELIARRREITALVADGLIAPGDARTQLEKIADQLHEYEVGLAGTPFTREVLADPEAAWETWTMPQRRQALGILFKRITVDHLQVAVGPTVDLSRITVHWI